VKTGDSNLNELLKTPQNQLESDCINRALMTAVHCGSSSNVGKLILRGATNIEEALEESKRLQQHAVTATLLIIKAAHENDISLIRRVYGEETTTSKGDLMGLDFEQVNKAAKTSAVRTFVPIEIARRNSANSVREELLMKTEIQLDKGIVSWHGLRLLQLEISWLKRIEWVKVLRLSQNEFSHLPTDISDYLTNCTTLSLQWNVLKEIPACLLQLPSIAELNLSHNCLEEIPDVPEWSYSLSVLNLSYNRLWRLPKSATASSIEKLDISYNQFRSVPTCICSFTTLQVLNLSGNHKIHSLPAELGRLKKLFNLGLDKLEDLNDPPKNVRETTADTMRYLSSRLRGERGFYRMKLMLVGKQQMGKSTIVGRLQGREVRDESTVGVDVSEWKFSPSINRKLFIFNIWDFAGQQEYYATHQCFLSKRSLYLLVWNIMEGKEGIADLKPWMSNISLRAPGSTVVVVATFLDKVSEDTRKSGMVEELCQQVQKLATQFHKLKIFHSMAVGLKGKQENVHLLKEVIYNAAAECTIGKQLIMGAKIPASYRTLDTHLANIRKKVESGTAAPIMHSGDFKNMVRSLKLVDLQDDDELRTVTHFLHEVGSLLHYDDRRNNLDDLYFVDPQWLCKLMSTIVTVEQKNPYLKYGILKTKNIPILFKDKLYPVKYMYQYLTLLHRFEIALPLDKEHSRILVPSLLPKDRPDSLEEASMDEQCYRRYIVFHHSTPPGLWSRLLSRIMNFIPDVRDYFDDLDPLIDECVVESNVNPSKRNHSTSELPSKRIFSIINRPLDKRSYNAFIKSRASESEYSNSTIEEESDIKLDFWRTGLHYQSPSLKFRIESLAQSNCKRSQVKDGVIVESSLDSAGLSIFGQLLDIVERIIMEWYPGLVKDYHSVVPCSECIKNNLDPVKEFHVNKLLQRIVENKMVIPCHNSKGANIHNVLLVDLVPELLFRDLEEKFLLNPEDVLFVQSKQSLIGEGGSGRVYQGVYRGQSVAVKLYISDSADKPGAWVKDMIGECKILQRLRHPCLMSMVGVCINPMALVMEEAPLGSLSVCLYKHHLAIPRVVMHRIAIQVVSALRFLHSVHIIFRDLKAGNVLVWSLDPDHLINCKVTDFNISAFADPGGIRGFSGTKGFVAPEVAYVNKAKERSIYNHTADVFSFGMLLYQMIARRRPFYNLPSYSIEAAIEEGQRPPLEDCPISRSQFFYLTQVMKQCWEGNPEDRPSTQRIVEWLSSATIQLTLSVIPFSNGGSVRCAIAVPPLPDSSSNSEAWIFSDSSQGTNLKILSTATATHVKVPLLSNHQVLCAQHHDNLVWLVTRMGLECSFVHLCDQLSHEIVHSFTLNDLWVNCIMSYGKVVCLGTKEGTCVLYPTNVDLENIEYYCRRKSVSCCSIDGIVLVNNHLWASTQKKILILNPDTLDELGMMVQPDNDTNVSVGKLIISESGSEVFSAFIGGGILSLWDVSNQSYKCCTNAQQMLQDRYSIDSNYDSVIIAMDASLDTVWVGMGSGHILVFASTGELVTSVNAYNNLVRFLTPVIYPDGVHVMLSGGKDYTTGETLEDLPGYHCKNEKGEPIDNAGVIILWEVLPAKYLRHVEYLCSGQVWLNDSTLQVAVQDTGLSKQVKNIIKKDLDTAMTNTLQSFNSMTVDSSDFKTGCSLADFRHIGNADSSDESDHVFSEDPQNTDQSVEAVELMFDSESSKEVMLSRGDSIVTTTTTTTTSQSDDNDLLESPDYSKEEALTDDSNTVSITHTLSEEDNCVFTNKQSKMSLSVTGDEEVISCTVNNNEVVLSYRGPVVLESIVTDLFNMMTLSSSDIVICYELEDELIPIQSQEQLEHYLTQANRPSLSVKTSN